MNTVAAEISWVIRHDLTLLDMPCTMYFVGLIEDHRHDAPSVHWEMNIQAARRFASDHEAGEFITANGFPLGAHPEKYYGALHPTGQYGHA